MKEKSGVREHFSGSFKNVTLLWLSVDVMCMLPLASKNVMGSHFFLSSAFSKCSEQAEPAGLGVYGGRWTKGGEDCARNIGGLIILQKNTAK